MSGHIDDMSVSEQCPERREEQVLTDKTPGHGRRGFGVAVSNRIGQKFKI